MLSKSKGPDSAMPDIPYTSSRPLAVAQLSSSVNLSRNYPLLFQIFHRSSHLLLQQQRPFNGL